MARVKTVTIYDKNGNSMEVREAYADAYLETGWSKKAPTVNTSTGEKNGG